jgi:hypothetical protein
VKDKLGVLRNLGGKADSVLVGGKMAEELRDGDQLPFPVELPSDVVAASSMESTDTELVPYDQVPPGSLGSTSAPRRARASPRE